MQAAPHIVWHSIADIHPSVSKDTQLRIAYNEDNNVIMTVTGSASQMRGSEFFGDKQLFPGYRPMDLIRNPACLRIFNGQEQIKL